jgi:hypothetical protein
MNGVWLEIDRFQINQSTADGSLEIHIRKVIENTEDIATAPSSQEG